MKEIIRTLDFYGFDQDSTMYDTNSTSISKVTEIKNEKYCKVDAESGDESSDDTSENTDPSTENEGGNTENPTDNGNSNTPSGDDEGLNTDTNEPTPSVDGDGD